MSGKIKKEHWILLGINLGLLAAFGAGFIDHGNYEFLIYIGVILFFIILIGATRNKVDYSLRSLTGLTVWSALHMAGGGIPAGDGVLYDVILIPLSQNWPILRYDQLVHIWGFGVATLVMFDVLKTTNADVRTHPAAAGVILVFAGLGIGALNEIVEFFVSTAMPDSGVGGYLNTALDLCADLIGALLALFYIRFSKPWNIFRIRARL